MLSPSSECVTDCPIFPVPKLSLSQLEITWFSEPDSFLTASWLSYQYWVSSCMLKRVHQCFAQVNSFLCFATMFCLCRRFSLPEADICEIVKTSFIEFWWDLLLVRFPLCKALLSKELAGILVATSLFPPMRAQELTSSRFSYYQHSLDLVFNPYLYKPRFRCTLILRGICW